MAEKLLCRKCKTGTYIYTDAEPNTDDWGNRAMKCENCGFKETLKEFCSELFSTGYPSYCCQKCGAEIGWLRRFMEWTKLATLLMSKHKCKEQK